MGTDVLSISPSSEWNSCSGLHLKYDHHSESVCQILSLEFLKQNWFFCVPSFPFFTQSWFQSTKEESESGWNFLTRSKPNRFLKCFTFALGLKQSVQKNTLNTSFDQLFILHILQLGLVYKSSKCLLILKQSHSNYRYLDMPKRILFQYNDYRFSFIMLENF